MAQSRPDIRHAVADDLPEILRMARAFVECCGLDVGYDAESCEATARMLMDEESGVLLIGNGGMIGGLLYPHFFNRDALVAQELFWWVDPPARGSGVGAALQSGFESWAAAAGALHITMVALASQKPLERLYRRNGYRPLECSWVKPVHGGA